MKKLVIALIVCACVCGMILSIHFSRNRSAAPSAMPSEVKAEPKTLWTCGMHPQVIQDHPGNCPICHMRLTPLKADAGAATSGEPSVHVDPIVVQNMGIQTALAVRGPITKSIHTVGVLMAPETGLHDISPKVSGWIVKLFANQEGMHVHKDDPLFELYSPDVFVAEQELVGASRSLQLLNATTDDSVKGPARSLVESAKTKLRLLDVSDIDIDAVVKNMVASKTVVFRSPASGAVIEKTVVEGSSIQAGQKLMRIEDHSSLWLDLQVYEDQLAMVSVGEGARAVVEAFPGHTFDGRITFIHPHVDHMSRTVVARAVLDNPDLSLRPGMYAAATIVTRPIEDAIGIPRESVIDTGTRQIVFIAQPGGHFEPREVHIGVLGDDDRVQVLDGLSAGETVVTSGQFLLDAESRTTEAIRKLRASSAPTSSNANDTQMLKALPATTQPSTTLAVAWCPMKKAHWLQQGDPIANPYFGKQMADCGSIQRTIAMPASSSRLADVAKAYLQLAANLTSDRLDPSAADALRVAAQKMDVPALSELRQAALAVASAPDISASRIALIPLSESMLQAMDGNTTPAMEGMRP